MVRIDYQVADAEEVTFIGRRRPVQRQPGPHHELVWPGRPKDEVVDALGQVYVTQPVFGHQGDCGKPHLRAPAHAPRELGRGHGPDVDYRQGRHIARPDGVQVALGGDQHRLYAALGERRYGAETSVFLAWLWDRSKGHRQPLYTLLR